MNYYIIMVINYLVKEKTIIFIIKLHNYSLMYTISSIFFSLNLKIIFFFIDIFFYIIIFFLFVYLLIKNFNFNFFYYFEILIII